jgi:hypothetical protein
MSSPIARPPGQFDIQPRLTGTAKIASGATLSDAIQCYQGTLLTLETPAALTSATINFQGSLDGVTYVPIYDNTNTRVSLTVTTNQARGYNLTPSVFVGWPYIKLEASGAEGADRLFSYAVGIV